MPEFFYFVCVDILCKDRMRLPLSAIKRCLHLQVILVVAALEEAADPLDRRKRCSW